MSVSSSVFIDTDEFARAVKPADIECIQTCKGPFRLEWTGLGTARFGLHLMSMPVGACAALGETTSQGENFHIALGVP